MYWMGSYCINPIGGSSGFKVHVADESGGLRVVGIFLSETDAQAWIATDRYQTETTELGQDLKQASPT